MSAFGGVIGFNREVDEETATEVAKLFVEAIAAPAYSTAALAVLQAKKNLRLVLAKPAGGRAGGEEHSAAGIWRRRRTARRLTGRGAGEDPAGADGGRVGGAGVWLEGVKHVKSNAIVYARAGQTVGGGGRADEPGGFGEDWRR